MDTPMLCACCVQFSVDHAMACERVGFIIQRHNELRDLEAEMLRMVCSDVEVEPVLQEVTGETINMALTKPLMPVWIFMLEVFGRDRDLHSSTSGCVTLMQTLTETWLLSRSTRSMRKRQYAERVMEIKQGTFTPLVFTTTGGMADEYVKYHSRLAELIANKKGETYSSAVSWIKAKVSFAIVRSAIPCLKGSRSRRRQTLLTQT